MVLASLTIRVYSREMQHGGSRGAVMQQLAQTQHSSHCQHSDISAWHAALPCGKSGASSRKETPCCILGPYQNLEKCGVMVNNDRVEFQWPHSWAQRWASMERIYICCIRKVPRWYSIVYWVSVPSNVYDTTDWECRMSFHWANAWPCYDANRGADASCNEWSSVSKDCETSTALSSIL